MDDQIRALRRQPDRTLEIPDVAMVRPDGTSERLNYLVLWDAGCSSYVVMMQRSLSTAEAIAELQRQVRRRMLLEAENVAQANAIKAANDTLNRINRDLADFTRIVAHDLKSPLRALRYFADDLERSLTEPSSDDDPHEHLHRLREQSARMSGMLTGLLAYARLDSKAEARATVDLSELVQRIVASLPRPAGMTIAIEGVWPTIETLEAPMDLVIRNVIDNAIKHHDRQQGRIVAACKPATTHLEIRISDDGPGIPERYRETVFKPYVRLVDRETDGLGMGLALVKRAAESAGANIGIEGNGGAERGTIVRIVWPLEILT
ncbi:MAG: HAMP domain-containing histidine kinase [Hyphomicrobiaceae bacterium]|nr:HAMP domain-containing histidine kinase [Hyphomicrobiaceae bacterium]